MDELHKTILTRLQSIDNLFEAGYITEEEYSTQCAKLNEGLVTLCKGKKTSLMDEVFGPS